MKWGFNHLRLRCNIKCTWCSFLALFNKSLAHTPTLLSAFTCFSIYISLLCSLLRDVFNSCVCFVASSFISVHYSFTSAPNLPNYNGTQIYNFQLQKINHILFISLSRLFRHLVAYFFVLLTFFSMYLPCSLCFIYCFHLFLKVSSYSKFSDLVPRNGIFVSQVSKGRLVLSDKNGRHAWPNETYTLNQVGPKKSTSVKRFCYFFSEVALIFSIGLLKLSQIKNSMLDLTVNVKTHTPSFRSRNQSSELSETLN